MDSLLYYSGAMGSTRSLHHPGDGQGNGVQGTVCWGRNNTAQLGLVGVGINHKP